MPWNENSLGLQNILCLQDGFSEYFTVVGDLGVHIIDQEWLSEVIFVVRVWHGFVMKGHHSSRIDISELVHTGGGVRVSVEESR